MTKRLLLSLCCAVLLCGAAKAEDTSATTPDTIYIVGNKDNAWGSMSASDNYDVLVETEAGSGVYYNEI